MLLVGAEPQCQWLGPACYANRRCEVCVCVCVCVCLCLLLNGVDQCYFMVTNAHRRCGPPGVSGRSLPVMLIVGVDPGVIGRGLPDE